MTSYRLFPFWIKFEYNHKNYKAIAEQIYLDEKFEVFRIKGEPGRFEIKSNRPIIRKRGLKKNIEMKALRADAKKTGMIKKIIECINVHISTIEK